MRTIIDVSFLVIIGVALIGTTVALIGWVVEQAVDPEPQVAVPVWMENVTSGCYDGAGHYRVFAYNGVPFTVTSDGSC